MRASCRAWRACREVAAPARLIAIALAGLAPWPAAAALVSDALAARVAAWQRVFDPWMPLGLLLVVLATAWVIVQGSQRAVFTGSVDMRFSWRRGLGLGALALGFASLAAAVNGHHTSQRLLHWDTAVATAAQTWVTPAARPVLRWVSDLGDVLVLTPLVLAVLGWLLLRRQRALALGWGLAVLTNSLAVRVLKELFGRERPPGAAELVTSGASFPSGHAAGALLVYGLLLWIVLPLVARRRWHAVLMLAGGVLIGAIVTSRVLLRVHFVSDVVGGLLLAGFTLLLATGLLRPWRPR